MFNSFLFFLGAVNSSSSILPFELRFVRGAQPYLDNTERKRKKNFEEFHEVTRRKRKKNSLNWNRSRRNRNPRQVVGDGGKAVVHEERDRHVEIAREQLMKAQEAEHVAQLTGELLARRHGSIVLSSLLEEVEDILPGEQGSGGSRLTARKTAC